MAASQPSAARPTRNSMLASPDDVIRARPQLAPACALKPPPPFQLTADSTLERAKLGLPNMGRCSLHHGANASQPMPSAVGADVVGNNLQAQQCGRSAVFVEGRLNGWAASCRARAL